MAKTGCECGAGLRNTYCPSGVEWSICPAKDAKVIIEENPDIELIDMFSEVENKIYGGDFWDLWLCKRCRRIQIWCPHDRYVSYRKEPFDDSLSVDQILNMEEWVVASDYDTDDAILARDFIAAPTIGLKFYLSPDEKTVYAYDYISRTVKFKYVEEYRQLEENLWRNEKGLFNYRIIDHVVKGAYYLDGSELDYECKNWHLTDGMYGEILGDALGVPFEFEERGTFECTYMVGYGSHNQPAGTWSDDSSMLLATCKSIKDNNGKVVVEDIRRNFLKWLNEKEFTANGEVFDIGHATLKALMTGEPRCGEYENGNGSLMRILPLAFTDCSDDEVRAVSAITHGHWISQEACVIYVHLLRECAKLRPLDEVIHELKLDPPFDRLCRLDEIDEKDIRSSGYVVDTLEAAIWCVLHSGSLSECLMKAVNLGDDTDTVACVAGGLGAIHQFALDEVPLNWYLALKNNELIQECLF